MSLINSIVVYASSFTSEFLFLSFTAILALVAIILCLLTRSRISRFMSGNNARDLEEVIHINSRKVDGLLEFQRQAVRYLQFLDERVKRKVGKTEIVRYNAYVGSGNGGNQSFSTAFVDERGDGVILSSIYSRERASVFSKPIKNWMSEYELSEEEKEVLKKIKNDGKENK